LEVGVSRRGELRVEVDDLRADGRSVARQDDEPIEASVEEAILAAIGEPAAALEAEVARKNDRRLVARATIEFSRQALDRPLAKESAADVLVLEELDEPPRQGLPLDVLGDRLGRRDELLRGVVAIVDPRDLPHDARE